MCSKFNFLCGGRAPSCASENKTMLQAKAGILRTPSIYKHILVDCGTHLRIIWRGCVYKKRVFYIGWGSFNSKISNYLIMVAWTAEIKMAIEACCFLTLYISKKWMKLVERKCSMWLWEVPNHHWSYHSHCYNLSSDVVMVLDSCIQENKIKKWINRTALQKIGNINRRSNYIWKLT
jgi:hypothetical protein